LGQHRVKSILKDAYKKWSVLKLLGEDYRLIPERFVGIPTAD
jgi:hypothetical protein